MKKALGWRSNLAWLRFHHSCPSIRRILRWYGGGWVSTLVLMAMETTREMSKVKILVISSQIYQILLYSEKANRKSAAR